MKRFGDMKLPIGAPPPTKSSGGIIMFKRRKWRRAVERGTREFVTGAVEAAGFGVGVVSGVACALVERVGDPLRVGDRVQQLAFEHMAAQYEKDPSSLKGEYLAMAMVYAAARKARKEVEEEEDRAKEARKDKFIEDALAEIVRRRDAKKK